MSISLRSSLPVLAAALLCCAFSSVPASAQADSDAAKAVLQMATRVENNIMALAKAIPADKYNFAPSSDIFKPGSKAEFATVRTVGQQLTHLAGLPFHVLTPFGVKPDGDVDVKSFDSMTSKDDILKALQASFDYENKVISTLTAENAFAPKGPRNATLISSLLMILNDDGDHYGQLVEYGRMNGIVPPASERQPEMRREGAPKM